MTRYVLQRTGALGDVILTTPIARWMRFNVLREGDELWIRTAYPDVYKNNTLVDGTLDPTVRWPKGFVVIDLDLAYENRPHLHIIHAYYAALKDFGIDVPSIVCVIPEVFSGVVERFDKPTVAVHAARSWKNRTLPTSFWLKVTGKLRKSNITPIIVGSARDQLSGGPYCGLPLIETAKVIKRCHAFVGSDSALLHLAAAVETRTVGLYTSASHLVRQPLQTDSHTSLFPRLDCYGCLARAPVPTVNLPTCERGDFACIYGFDVQTVVNRVTLMVQRSRGVMQSAG